MTPRVTSSVDRGWISYPGLRSCRRLTGATNASAPLGLLMAQGRYAVTIAPPGNDVARSCYCRNERVCSDAIGERTFFVVDGSVPQRGTRMGNPAQARNERSTGLKRQSLLGNEVTRGVTRAFYAQNVPTPQLSV